MFYLKARWSLVQLRIFGSSLFLLNPTPLRKVGAYRGMGRGMDRRVFHLISLKLPPRLSFYSAYTPSYSAEIEFLAKREIISASKELYLEATKTNAESVLYTQRRSQCIIYEGDGHLLVKSINRMAQNSNVHRPARRSHGHPAMNSKWCLSVSIVIVVGLIWLEKNIHLCSFAISEIIWHVSQLMNIL